MKEIEQNFRGEFFKGLRNNSRRDRNTERLVECYNLMPTEEGYTFHDPVIDLNSTYAWGGMGAVTPSLGTRNITLNIQDYVTDANLASVSVYLDGVLKGTTDGSGLITIASVAIGGHTLKLVKTGYTDSDDDTLLNDYIMVT